MDIPLKTKKKQVYKNRPIYIGKTTHATFYLETGEFVIVLVFSWRDPEREPVRYTKLKQRRKNVPFRGYICLREYLLFLLVKKKKVSRNFFTRTTFVNFLSTEY